MPPVSRRNTFTPTIGRHIRISSRTLLEQIAYLMPFWGITPRDRKILLDKKLYLSGGVAAAFECKTTLKSTHITKAVRTASSIRKNLPERTGSPYKELNSTIIYGLLAHSHSWKGDKSKPLENIENAFWNERSNYKRDKSIF